MLRYVCGVAVTQLNIGWELEMFERGDIIRDIE